MKRGIVIAAIGVFVALGAASAAPSKVRTEHVPTTITHDGDVALSAGGSCSPARWSALEIAPRGLPDHPGSR